MPFKLRLGKRSQQYNVANKDLYVIPIELLTKESVECTLCSTSVGQECLTNVCQKLGLHQTEYFGLLFKSKRGTYQWVDSLKPLKKQLDKYSTDARVYLRLQFFVPNVQMLWDEMTRYHYFLQLKSFVIDGRLKCSRDEAILLTSFSLQSEFGDFNPERHSAEYLVNFALFPRTMVANCTKEVQDMLMEFVINAYRNLHGVPPNVAEIYYISECQQLEGFGQEGFPAKDTETGGDVCIGVAMRGIFVLHLTSPQTTEQFLWTDIANLIHQKKVFSVERNSDGVRKNYVTFDNDYARCIWRTCVEQHQYFMKAARSAVDDDPEDDRKTAAKDRPSLTGHNGIPFQSYRISTLSNRSDSHSLKSSTSLPQQKFAAHSDMNSAKIGYHHCDFSVPNTLGCSKTNITPITTNSMASQSMFKLDQRYLYDNGNSPPAAMVRAQSSNEINLNQIQIAFPSYNNGTDFMTNAVTQPESDHHHHHHHHHHHPAVSNVTTVQVHHQPSWATFTEQHCETGSELTYEQRLAMLPPYRNPPDYDTFMRQKYGNISVSMGNIHIASCTNHVASSVYNKYGFVSSSNSTSSVPHFIQQSYAQYRNYTDLSNLDK